METVRKNKPKTKNVQRINKTFLITLGLGAIFLVVAYSFLAFAFLESRDIHPYRPIGFAIIPQDIRQIEPVAQCAPRRFIRRYQECGGICGEYVGVQFGSTQLSQVAQTYQLEAMRREGGFKNYFVAINDKPPYGSVSCPNITIEFYEEWGID